MLKKLKEEIYGNLATIYHGTRVDPLLLKSELFLPGSGDHYGIGMYGVYNQEEGSNTLNGEYGTTIIKILTSTYNVLNWDTILALDSAEKMYAKIKTQLIDKVFASKVIAWFKDYMNDTYGEWENKESSMLQDGELFLFTSDIAKPCADYFREHNYFGNGENNPKINGMIYTGRKDGNCMVIYNMKNYEPYSYRNYKDTTWTKYSSEEKSQFMKEQRTEFRNARGGTPEAKNNSVKEDFLAKITEKIYSLIGTNHAAHLYNFSKMFKQMQLYHISLAEVNNSCRAFTQVVATFSTFESATVFFNSFGDIDDPHLKYSFAEWSFPFLYAYLLKYGYSSISDDLRKDIFSRYSSRVISDANYSYMYPILQIIIKEEPTFDATYGDSIRKGVYLTLCSSGLSNQRYAVAYGKAVEKLGDLYKVSFNFTYKNEVNDSLKTCTYEDYSFFATKFMETLSHTPPINLILVWESACFLLANYYNHENEQQLLIQKVLTPVLDIIDERGLINNFRDGLNILENCYLDISFSMGYNAYNSSVFSIYRYLLQHDNLKISKSVFVKLFEIDDIRPVINRIVVDKMETILRYNGVDFNFVDALLEEKDTNVKLKEILKGIKEGKFKSFFSGKFYSYCYDIFKGNPQKYPELEEILNSEFQERTNYI